MINKPLKIMKSLPFNITGTCNLIMICRLGIVIIFSSLRRFLYEDWHYNSEKRIVTYANDNYAGH